MNVEVKERLKVIKRDNKKVDFKEEKIAVAIKKGFNSVQNEEYTEEDVNKVFLSVIKDIEDNYKDKKTINIEEIQDIVEKQLLKHIIEMFMSYSNYRDRRTEARAIFSSKQNQLLKVLESITLKEALEVDEKRENANIDGNSECGTMLQYGSALLKNLLKLI